MADNIIEVVPPAVIPNYIGQRYTDTVQKKSYIAVGTTSIGDWAQTGGTGAGGNRNTTDEFPLTGTGPYTLTAMPTSTPVPYGDGYRALKTDVTIVGQTVTVTAGFAARYSVLSVDYSY